MTSLNNVLGHDFAVFITHDMTLFSAGHLLTHAGLAVSGFGHDHYRDLSQALVGRVRDSLGYMETELQLKWLLSLFLCHYQAHFFDFQYMMSSCE